MLIAIGDFQHKVEDGKAYKEPFCIINIIPDNEHILFWYYDKNGMLTMIYWFYIPNILYNIMWYTWDNIANWKLKLSATASSPGATTILLG